MVDQRPAPAVIASIGRAFHDSISALGAMPGLVAVTFAALAAETLALDALSRSVTPATAESALLTAADFVVYSAIATPLSVALYRFIALGERGVGALARQGDVLVDSFVMLALVSLPLTAPFVLLEIEEDPAGFPILGATGFALTFVGLAAAVKLTLLFPAIALRGPGASVRAAWAMTAGLFWRLVAILTAILLLLATPLTAYAAVYGAEGAGWAILYAAFTTATLLPATAVGARFYMWRTDMGGASTE